MRRFLTVLYLLLSNKYVLATKENDTWTYLSNCDPLDLLDCALDLEEKCLTRLDNIPDEDYQAEINVQDAFLIANNSKLDQ